MADRSRARTLLFTAVLLVGLVGLLELGAHAAIAVLGADPRFDFTPLAERRAEMVEKLEEVLAEQGRALVALDPVLGWRYRPGYAGALYSSNAAGHRGRRDYAPTPPPGSLRLSAFGDSFVHGNEVADDEAWSAVLEAEDPRVEVLNHGVGGYGTDQALLLYEREGLAYAPDVVALGFVEVDYARNLNRFRRFLSVHELPLFKPRFVLDPAAPGGLREVPNPFPERADLEALLADPGRARRAAPDDWFYESLVWDNPLYDVSAVARLLSSGITDVWRARLRPDGLYRGDRFNRDAEAYQVLVALIDRFAALAEQRGQPFFLMVFPSRDGDIWGDGGPVYQPLLDDLRGRHAVLDLAPALRADPAVTPGNLRKTSNHYGPEANATVGRAVRAFLIERGWLPESGPAAPERDGDAAPAAVTPHGHRPDPSAS